MRVGDELAVAPRAETDAMPRFSAIGGDRIALRARGDELHRAVQPFGGKRDQRGTGRHRSF